MSRTPWNWIITAFVFAALFLISFGMYQKGSKSNDPTVLTNLQKENKRLSQQIDERDRKIEERDRTITALRRDLDDERKKKSPAPTPVVSSDGSVEQLQKIIESKDKTIVSKDRKISQLRDSIQSLKNYINSD